MFSRPWDKLDYWEGKGKKEEKGKACNKLEILSILREGFYFVAYNVPYLCSLRSVGQADL